MKNLKKRAALSVAALALLTGCGYEDLNSLTLPGVKGKGDDAYTVKIKFPDAQELVANSPVRVDDLNVGSVKDITLDGYQPVVTIRLEGDVNLPANAVAKIGQTSLLGAKHVELAPPTGEKPAGRLHDGDVIGPERATTFPATEQVLAAASALLNGGGLQQIKTITTEVNKILGGREGTVRSLLAETRTFVTGLDGQKNSIVKAITQMDRLADRFRSGNDTVAGALEALPSALQVVSEQREQLVKTLESLGRFGDRTAEFLEQGGGRDLVRNVAALRPTLKGLADAGNSLTESLWVVPSVVFPLQTLDQYVRGDFYNLTVTLDLRTAFLSKALLEGTPLDSLIGTPNGLLGQAAGGNAALGNPLTDPLKAPAPGTTPGAQTVPGAGAAAGSSNSLSNLLSQLLGGGR